MSNTNVQLFKSKFCQWADKNLSKEKQIKFKNSLDKVLVKHLPNTDNFLHFRIGNLNGCNDININFIQKGVLVGSEKKTDTLYVGTITPSWEKGLRQFCNDEDIYDLISWFFHFASQYVARSQTINVMAAILLIYDKTSDFYSHTLIFKYIHNDENLKKIVINEFNKYAKIISRKYGSREKAIQFWTKRINCLDSYINRLFFNYMRSYELFESGFEEESLTSLDKTTDIIFQYGRKRIFDNNSQSQAIDVYRYLGMTEREVVLLEQLNDIRNMFGGHPSISKWWDFGEIFETSFDVFFITVKKLVMKVVLHENKHRVIEKYPAKWSNWFEENATMIWEAVWYQEIYKNIR